MPTNARSAALLACASLGIGLAACAAPPEPPRAWSSMALPADPAPMPANLLVLDEHEPEPSDDSYLGQQLANPISILTRVPIQFDHDDHAGNFDDGDRDVLTIEPVVPFSLNEEWNLISRTSVPLVRVEDLTPTSGTDKGLGDVLQSFYFSPVESTEGDVTWGVGPAVLLPTASNDKLGQEQLAVGPTGVVVEQDGPWTYGALANHLWSVTGDKDRKAVNATYLQPFVAYTTPDAWTTTLNLESTRNWQSEEWIVPANLIVSKVMRLGDQPVSVGFGVRRWFDSPDGAPEGWGYRLQFTLLYPEETRRTGTPEDAM